jgi:hypothetical protein
LLQNFPPSLACTTEQPLGHESAELQRQPALQVSPVHATIPLTETNSIARMSFMRSTHCNGVANRRTQKTAHRECRAMISMSHRCNSSDGR